MNNWVKMMSVSLLCFFLWGILSSPVCAEEIYKNEAEAYAQAVKDLGDSVGTYPVTLHFYDEQGELVEKVIEIQIVGDHTVSNQFVAIDAISASVYEEEVHNLTAEDWMSICQVYAWNLNDGKRISDISVDSSRVKANVGSYSLVFSIPNQISKTVTIQVLKTGTSLQYEANLTSSILGEVTENDQLSWNFFENNLFGLIGGLLVVLMFIPLLLFIIEYLFTRKLVNKVIDTMVK